jgi:hypothetical protein
MTDNARAGDADRSGFAREAAGDVLTLFPFPAIEYLAVRSTVAV